MSLTCILAKGGRCRGHSSWHSSYLTAGLYLTSRRPESTLVRTARAPPNKPGTWPATTRQQFLVPPSTETLTDTAS